MIRNLQAPNFAAVARKGCFVYAYIRTDGSPYYVGVASHAYRPIKKDHTVGVPADRRRIRIMRSGLTWEQAASWERRYIAHYGRLDIKTGILRNRTEGGEGTCGRMTSKDTKDKIRQKAIGRKVSEATKALKRQQMLGTTKPQETIAKTIIGRNIRTANTYGLDVDRYLSVSPEMRILIVKRVKKGHSGEDLWLPRGIQPITAKFCREKGVDVNKYAAASRKVQCWVRDHFRRGKACPAEFAAA